jgi:Glycosyl transferases group 1
MTGGVRNVEEYLQIADFYVFPSQGGEGLPTALIEAIACGLPVVATRATGVIELRRKRRSGSTLRKMCIPSTWDYFIFYSSNMTHESPPKEWDVCLGAGSASHGIEQPQDLSRALLPAEVLRPDQAAVDQPSPNVLLTEKRP